MVLTSDGGGQVSAARKPVRGAGRVARFLAGLVRFVGPAEQVTLISVNGMPGLGVVEDGRLTTVVSFTVHDGRISRIDLVRAPHKLPVLPHN